MLSLILLIGLFKLVNCVFYNSNSTDLSTCFVSYSRSGTVYKDFYPLTINENDTLVLDFHFAVLASSDAHILLAEFDNLTKTDPAYEIVIGAGGNTFSDIRRMQKSEVKQSTRIKGLLSALDPRFFWLHITKDGAIRVGVEGQNASFIEWIDPEPLKVKFVSFSTWSGIEAKWYFDCDRSQSEEEALKKLSTRAKLRRFLLKLYDPLVYPIADETTTADVYMTLDVTDLKFDEDHVSLIIRGFSLMRWHDEKLHWDPSLYQNISVITVDRKEIWTPSLKCFQIASSTEDFLLGTILSVNKIGTVWWESAFRMVSQCEPSNKGDWPRDIYVCKMFFSLTDDYSNVFLNVDYNDSNLVIQKEDDQWNVLQALLFEVPLNSSMHTPAWGLSFEIRRSSLIYSTVFLFPLFVITSCLLFMFWVSPRGNTKLFLGCSQIIIEILILLSLAHFIPHKSTGIPLLIILYGLCLVCSLSALLISVAVINLCQKKRSKPLPHCISNILTKKSVKTALILPNIVIPEDYGDLDLSTSFNNVSRSSLDKDHTVWVLLTMAIERILFFVYLICMIVIIIKYILACF